MAKFGIIFLIYFFLLLRSVHSQLLRFCKHSLTSDVRVYNLTYQHETILDLERSTLQLVLHVSWDVDVPPGLQLDGFIYHFNDPLIGPGNFTIPASNVCNIGHESYWLNTTNSTCSNDTSMCSESVESIPSDYRLCPISYPSTEGKCKGTGSDFVNVSATGGYSSVPLNVRSLTFNIDFHQPYFLRILAYHRQFFHDIPTQNETFSTHIPPYIDCPTLVREKAGINELNATEFCCALGIPHVMARDIRFGNAVVDFVSGEVEMQVTWLPPIDSLNLSNFRYQYFQPGQQVNSFINFTLDTIPAGEEQSQLSSCGNSSVRYFAIMTGLRPNHNYEIEIHTLYNSKDAHRRNCKAHHCLVRQMFTVPAINPCNQTFGYCDKLANCSADDETGATSFNATCRCPTGYDGNGRNKEKGIYYSLYGDGCFDSDYCIPSRTPCDNTAICTDFEVPEIGANCTCSPGYFGDGYLNGSGCTHKSVIALAVTIPVIIIVALISSLMIRRVYNIRRRKDEFAWEQFIANDALRGYTVLDQFASENEGDIWMPTFGDRWELDRSKLRIGDVIGRGNYGIVHRGYYDGVNESGDAAETAVAIKTVKDGANEEFRIKEFLTEIGFMINIGDHPNILKVFGCCTTEKPIYLITDYLKYGDLLHFLWDAREPTASFIDPVYHVTEKSLYQMARQVALGMDYLTKARIIHGDIAARNVLVGEDLICKLSDFGLANDVYRYGVIQGQSERCVPFKWISPERMMAGKVPITSKSDVWSFGNLLFEMITLGCTPHNGVETNALQERLKEGYRMKQPSTCSDMMYSIMIKCWKWRPSSRPSFSSIIKMIDGAVDALRDADYVNLADIVMDDVKGETYLSEVSDQKKESSDDELIRNVDTKVNGKTDKENNLVTVTGFVNQKLQLQV